MLNIRKSAAIRLRKLGMSYRSISAELGIARSTLSSWLREIELTSVQRERLRKQWIEGTKKGRMIGSEMNRKNKLLRLKKVDETIHKYFSELVINNSTLEMLFVGLYLGDGFKYGGKVGLGNSNPNIVWLFVTLLRRLYYINESKIRAQIFARADQSEETLITYWSSLLGINPLNFHRTQFDKRTSSKTSWESYHGVCAVVYADTLLQRRILALGQEMIKYVSTLKIKGS